MLLLFLLFFGLREHKGKKFTPHSLRNLSWRKYWFLYFGSLWCSMNDERCTQYYPRLCEWSISVRNSIRANQHSFHVSLSLSSSLSLWVLFSVRVGPLFTRRIQPIEMSFFYLETALFPFKNGCFWAEWRMRTLLLRTQLIFHEFVQTENFTILAIFFFLQTEISNDKIYNVDFGWVEWIGREQRNVQLDNIFMKNDLSNALFTSFFVCEHSQRYSADTCQTHTDPSSEPTLDRDNHIQTHVQRIHVTIPYRNDCLHLCWCLFWHCWFVFSSSCQFSCRIKMFLYRLHVA